MPTYVYKCDSCGTQFEQFQSFKDEPIRTCPACASPVRRVFQPVGIVFKGSGWYITDSRKSSTASVANEDTTKIEKTEKTDKPETNGNGDAASKPETKTEPAKTEASKPEPSSAPAPASDTKSSASTSATA